MRNRARSWLQQTALRDPLEQKQAPLLQIILIVTITLLILALPLVASAGATLASKLLGVLSSVLLIAFAFAALIVLRRGFFRRAVVLAALGFLPGQAVTFLSQGLGNSPIMLLMALPLMLVGLLAGRKALLAAFGISALLVTVADALVGRVQPLLETRLAPVGGLAIVVVTILILGMLTFVLDRFGGSLRDALNETRSRELQLERMHTFLEEQVDQRTQALQTALRDLTLREERLVQALAENERQQQTIRGLSTPVLPLNANTLVIPLVGVLDTTRLHDLHRQALSALEKHSTRHLVLDITGVPFVDTPVAQGLLQMVQAARLLGTRTLLVGIHPEVAQALVGLGVGLEGLHTVIDLQAALNYIVTLDAHKR